MLGVKISNLRCFKNIVLGVCHLFCDNYDRKNREGNFVEIIFEQINIKLYFHCVYENLL